MGNIEFLVDLNKIEDIKEFVRCAEKYDSDILVKNQDKAFKVDATSIMALFGMDLSRPVLVQIPDNNVGESFKNDVAKFIVM